MAPPLILLADDDRDTLDAYDALFRQRGYAVQCVTDGASALQKAIELRPALVILDVSLPRMDGLEVLTRLRAHAECAGIPVIVVTGHAFPEDLPGLRRQGCDAVVTKPCEPDELCRMVQLLLDGADARSTAPARGEGDPGERRRSPGSRRTTAD